MMKNVSMPVLVVVVALALSGVALAYDDDDYRGGPAQARRYGYQQGYNDGIRHGRDDREDRRGYNLHSEDWEHASHGYADWMGPYHVFQSSYRDGYREGYEAGFHFHGDRDGDGHFHREDYRHDRDDWGGRQTARDFGYRDGCSVAREDLVKGKPYNPGPRGKYGDRDRGYVREFGDKDDYREQYSRAYREGYESVYARR